MGPFLALGWATLAGAPISLVALALASGDPDAPRSLVSHSAWASLIAAALGFVAATLWQRDARGPARAVGAACVFVILSAIALLVLL